MRRLLTVQGDLRDDLPWLQKAAAGDHSQWVRPAPDNPGRFTLGTLTLIDGQGQVLRQVKPSEGVSSSELSSPDPWGRTSKEMRIRISIGGSGWDGVEVTQLPIRVMQPPWAAFPLQIKGEPCVTLFSHPGTGEQIRCLPPGTQLAIHDELPQGTGGTWNGPASITNEGTWIYVQTAPGSPGGENGWVLLRENRMGWAK